MKVHIVTGHFYPQLHPRAFRANELALEFARRGFDITVTNCWTIKDFDYAGYAREAGFKKINNLGFFNTPLQVSNGVARKAGWMKRCLFFLKEYLLAGSVLVRANKMASKLVIENDTELVISLSTPFTCLLGVAKFISKNGRSYVAIADSGDPFYYSKQYSKAPWFKPLEKWVYKQYDFLTIPTENAIPLYAPLIENNKIKIIPQGFRMDNMKLYEGDFNGPVRIAYAGVFYRDIRNPEFLFKHLSSIKHAFELHLFMRNKDAMIDEFLEKYPSLQEKVFVTSLPHDELLYELSRMHFLINIENLSNTQMPSKLIDYGMTGRPIFSCNSVNFSPEKFNRFIEGDYSGAYVVDIKQYDIRHIADQFLALTNEVVCKL